MEIISPQMIRVVKDLIAEAKREERNRLIGWLEGQKDLLSGGSLAEWTDELVSRLKALPPYREDKQ